MTDDFDAIIGQAKRIVGLSTKIAGDVFPRGVILECTRCRFTQRGTAADAARYLSTGWPTHCGAAMRAEQPANR